MQLQDLAATEASALEATISASFDKLIRTASADADRQIAAAKAEAQKAVEKVLAERNTLASTLEDEKRHRAQAEKQLKDAERRLKDTEKQLKEHSAAQAFADAARREAEAARDKEAAAREEEAALRAAAERDLASERAHARDADRDHARELKQAEAVHADQLKAERARLTKGALQPLDHLRGAFDRYRAVATIDEALQILLESMAAEFSRVAVFDVNAHRLEVSRHTGFDGHDMSKVVVPLTTQSPLTRAVKDGKVQGLTARELTETTRALVGGSPSFVLVLPVPIRGGVRAVVYADDSGQAAGESSPERRVRFAEILLWHTVPLLTRLAYEEEALAEFREYAASIVNDLESVYVADSAKHKAADLRKRLQLNLQYAKRRFSERMQSEGAAAAHLLDEQLAAAIERKSETAFGKDLAVVAS